MLNVRHPMFWFGCVVALAVILFWARSHFSAEARARRRRDRSHGPVISRKRGPAIRLLLDLKKSKRDRKG